jgi:hypothetical protein
MDSGITSSQAEKRRSDWQGPRTGVFGKLPDDLVQELKHRASEEGLPLVAVLTEAVKQFVGADTGGAK